MNSPRYAPAGLLVECGKSNVIIDGGPGANPSKKIDAWLVTDERAELVRNSEVDMVLRSRLDPDEQRGRILGATTYPIGSNQHELECGFCGAT